MTDGVRQEIEGRVRVFETTYNQGDLAAHAALYTEDATLMPPDSAVITGRAGIQQFWQSVRDSGVGRVALSTQQVDASGDMAAEVGTAELTVRSPDGQSSIVPLKYVVVWKRQGGGPWMMAVDIWNSLPTV